MGPTSRTFDELESGLSASTVEKTFKPMSVTRGCSRKLGKQEQTLRKQLEYFSGGGGNSSDSEEDEEVAGDVFKADVARWEEEVVQGVWEGGRRDVERVGWVHFRTCLESELLLLD
ncbi:hypothetical protein K4K59_011163 [Colletotrichum sp. SAR11_240]|nr:hypothetical protein K4K59_011163 [Colletotrichum sp. SAR11_240]